MTLYILLWWDLCYVGDYAYSKALINAPHTHAISIHYSNNPNKHPLHTHGYYTMHYSNDPDKFPHTHNITVPRWKRRFSSITEVKERRAWLVAYLDGWHHLPCNTLMSLINAPQIHANSMYYS